MNVKAQAESIAAKLAEKDGTPHVVALDPATITILITILTQAYKLLKWWKPEWFINWQLSRLIENETAGTHLEYRPDLQSEILGQIRS